MNQSDVEDVVRTGEPRPFRPLAELEDEDKRRWPRRYVLNRQQRRAIARGNRRKGRH